MTSAITKVCLFLLFTMVSVIRADREDIREERNLMEKVLSRDEVNVKVNQIFLEPLQR